MTKEESQKFYEELRKTYTDEEIAESFVWSIDRSPEEEKELRDAMSAYRKKHYADMGWWKRNTTKIRIRYLGWKYRFQDWWRG